MANKPKNIHEVAAEANPNSMATALTQMIGHKLKPEEVEHLKNRLNGIQDNANLEDLFADYALLVKAWNFKTHGPEILQIIQHIQAACRGFIPTGDGVIDETLTKIVGELLDLEQKVGSRLAAPEEWQQLYQLLNQASTITQDIQQAPRIKQQVYEEACAHIKQAIALFNAPLQKLNARLETQAANVAEEIASPRLT